MNVPSQTVSQYPFENVEGNLFPPVCLRTHWDPTKMLKHILPQQKVSLPMDFRPLVKVCKNYVTSAAAEMAPVPPDNMVFPMGGSFYPPTRYADAINDESVLRTLDQPLDRWCTQKQYIPSEDSNMYVAGSTVPDRRPISNAFVAELAMPKALLRRDGDSCRSENDRAYAERSGRLFGNPTKQDRYGAEKYYALPGGLSKGEPMPHGGVPYVRPTRSAIKGRNPMAESQLPPAQTSGTSFVGTAQFGQSAPVW